MKTFFLLTGRMGHQKICLFVLISKIFMPDIWTSKSLVPTVRDITRDGTLSTYDESVLNVLKLSKVSFRGKCMGHPLKLPSPTALAWLGHFPIASHTGFKVCPKIDSVANSKQGASIGSS
jgi:hypothetical protein